MCPVADGVGTGTPAHYLTPLRHGRLGRPTAVAEAFGVPGSAVRRDADGWAVGQAEPTPKLVERGASWLAAEGKLGGDATFVASTLLAKYPSRFEGRTQRAGRSGKPAGL